MENNILIFIALFELLAIGFLVLSVSGYKEQKRKLKTFVPVEVIIRSFSVQSHQDTESNTYYTPSVSYEYTVDGETHIGTSYSPIGIQSYNRKDIEKLGQTLSIGGTHQGFYNPAKPSESYLVQRQSMFPVIGMIVSGLLMLGGLLVFAVMALA